MFSCSDLCIRNIFELNAMLGVIIHSGSVSSSDRYSDIHANSLSKPANLCDALSSQLWGLSHFFLSPSASYFNVTMFSDTIEVPVGVVFCGVRLSNSTYTSAVFVDTPLCKCKADVVEGIYSVWDVQCVLRGCHCVFRAPDRLWICPDTFSASCCYVSAKGLACLTDNPVHCE